MTYNEKIRVLDLYKNILSPHSNLNLNSDKVVKEYFDKINESNNGKFASLKTIEDTQDFSYYGKHKLYEIAFKNQLDLYDYLVSEPLVNKRYFFNQSSNKETNSFNEMNYRNAVEYLKGGYSANLSEMLSLKQRLEKAIEFPSIRRKVTKSVTGSRINPNSFIANDPKRYYKLERLNEREFITIHLNMAFYHAITKDQILNRGVLLLSLIDILENNNYSVKLNSFFLMEESDEYMYIKINLKNINDYISTKAVVFPFTSPAFFRRCIFRVMESMPVSRDWGNGYGCTVSDDGSKEILRLNKDDIYIGPPDSIGIGGYNLSEDAEKFLNYIDMDKYVKVKIKR